MLDAANEKTEVQQTDDQEVVDNADDDCEPTEEEIQETLRLMAEEDGITEQPDDEDEAEPTVEEIAAALQKAVDEKNGVKSVEPVAPKKPIPPFYSQYVELKDSYPDCIILIRLGDFYEAFNDDAQTLSDELNLTLTGRDVGLESRVPIIGFPIMRQMRI